MKWRYVCDNERLLCVVDERERSLKVHYSKSGNGALNADNNGIFKSISNFLELAYKKNGIDLSDQILIELSLKIHGLIVSGEANAFTIPMISDVDPEKISWQ